MTKANFGVVGMAVMGRNLALNIESRGYTVAIYNRDVYKRQVDDPSMNAFATGSNPQNAAVAATTGLLAVMNREELEGVIGHEVSHIRNYEMCIRDRCQRVISRWLL